jgi:hypothetical protein
MEYGTFNHCLVDCFADCSCNGRCVAVAGSDSAPSPRRLSTIVDEVVLGVVIHAPGTSSSEA